MITPSNLQQDEGGVKLEESPRNGEVGMCEVCVVYEV